MLVLKILGAVLALGLGLWLGRPGPRQSLEEIEAALAQPDRRRQQVQRHFTPMDWFRNRKRAPDRLSRTRFRVSRPGEAEGRESGRERD